MRHIISTLLGLLIVFLIGNAALAAGADPFAVPSIPNGETRVFKVMRQPSAGQSSIFVRNSENVSAFSIKTTWAQDGKDRLMLVERKEKKNGGQIRTWNFVFRASQYLKFERYSVVETRPDGGILTRQEGKPFVPNRSAPPNLVHLLVASEIIRTYPLKEGASWEYMSWNPPIEDVTRVFVRVLGSEKIATPAGNMDTWRVALDIDLNDILGKWRGIEFLIKPLIPQFTGWFVKSPNGPMVQFRTKSGSGNHMTTEDQKLVEMTR